MRQKNRQADRMINRQKDGFTDKYDKFNQELKS
jgi:hypothetical protein